MSIEVVQYCYTPSPIGPILLAGKHNILHLLALPRNKQEVRPAKEWQLYEDTFPECRLQLQEYFSNRRTSFDIKYYLNRSDFQIKVLQAVAKIPYGRTQCYSGIAKQIQSPKAARAVGLVNASNPLPILIPCHRVIGKNGSLTGFAGGMDSKAFLLDLESRSSRL